MKQKLNQYKDKWLLSDFKKICQTHTSTIYKTHYQNQPAILKLLSPAGQKDESNGANALKHFQGHGAAKVFKADGQAHLLEYIDGENLSSLVRKQEDEQATQIISQVLAKIHQSSLNSLPKQNLSSLSERFKKLFVPNQLLADQSLQARAIAIANELLQQQTDQVVLHGDVHHDNIMYSHQRGWLFIDPKGLYGDRVFDYVNPLFNPAGFPELVTNKARLERSISILCESANIEKEKLKRFAFCYGVLSAIWSIEDGFDPAETLALTRMFAVS